jgi:hypothetical protein
MAVDIITNMTNELGAIQQTSFEQFFQKWKRWGGALLLEEIILKGIGVTKL